MAIDSASALEKNRNHFSEVLGCNIESKIRVHSEVPESHMISCKPEDFF